LSYTVGQELVFINGVLQKRGDDYTATTGNSITGLTALTAGDIVSVWTVNAFSVTNAISNTLVDAKGDLIVATGADTPGRLAVGSNNQVLTADSTTGTGLKWATPSSPTTNFTLLNTGGTALTGATTITINNIGGYNKYHIRIDGASTVNASAAIAFRFNSDNTNTMHATGIQFDGTTLSVVWGEDNRIIVGETGTAAGDDLYCNIQVDGANATGLKSFVFSTAANGSSAVNIPGMVGYYRGTSVITSLNILSLSGNFDAGTVYVYGA